MLKVSIFIDIYFVKQDTYSKMIKNKDVQVFMENLRIEKKKAQTFFDLPKRGFEPQIFSNFPAHDLNFHVRSGARDQIKTSF